MRIFWSIDPYPPRSHSARSGELDRPVIVAMIPMRIMKPAVHEVIDVVAMWDRFMPTPRRMTVRAVDFGRTLDRIGRVYREGMLIDMIPMDVMEMAVMKVVDMIVVADRHVSAARAVAVHVVGMLLLGAS
jgi:hypothetical protein